MGTRTLCVNKLKIILLVNFDVSVSSQTVNELFFMMKCLFKFIFTDKNNIQGELIVMKREQTHNVEKFDIDRKHKVGFWAQTCDVAHDKAQT